MKIIYTSAEEDWKHWQHVKPTFVHYAERVGATLVNLPKSDYPNPQWAIWDAMRKSMADVPQGQNAVWIDSDIWIRHDAPDLFGDLMQGRFMVCEPSYPARIHPDWSRMWKKTSVPNPRPYPITGIVSWDTVYAPDLVEWMETNHTSYDKRLGDQELLAVALWECNTPFWFFPPSWHRMKKWVEPDTKFLHAAGARKFAALKRLSKL